MKNRKTIFALLLSLVGLSLIQTVLGVIIISAVACEEFGSQDGLIGCLCSELTSEVTIDGASAERMPN